MSRIIVLDTETTGVDPLVDKLVELAAINLDTDLSFETLINPGRDIPPGAMAIHHITEWMVEGKPSGMTAIHEFMKYAVPTKAKPDSADLPIFCAHNAKFDQSMLAPLLGNLRPRWLCTMKIASRLWPDAPGFSNQVLRYWLGLKPIIPEGLAPHRAMYDIICTREILRVQLLQTSLEQALEWSTQPMLMLNCPLKKYKGQPWTNCDTGYLNWILKADDMSEDIQYWAEKELVRRGARRG